MRNLKTKQNKMIDSINEHKLLFVLDDRCRCHVPGRLIALISVLFLFVPKNVRNDQLIGAVKALKDESNDSYLFLLVTVMFF